MSRALVILAAAVLGIGAAEKKVSVKALPPAVRDAVKQQSAGAKLRGFTQEVEDGKTIYEAEMTLNGHGKDVSFDPAGNVVSVEEEVTLASIPAEARAAIQKAVGTGKLNKVELVTENGKTFYEAALRRDGKSLEIQVDAQGATLK